MSAANIKDLKMLKHKKIAALIFILNSQMHMYHLFISIFMLQICWNNSSSLWKSVLRC